MKIIFATGNRDKMREIREILGAPGIEILSMKEAGIATDIVEDGKTFEENARIKARAVAAAIPDRTGTVVLADDSGLAIDYLDGAPGVFSARFMGEDTSYEVKNRALIEKLQGVPKPERGAQFVCAIAAVLPDDTEKTVRGVFRGWIGYEPEGENGFGYDPIFQVEEYACSSAAMTPEQKNAVSHRGQALREMKRVLEACGF